MNPPDDRIWSANFVAAVHALSQGQLRKAFPELTPTEAARWEQELAPLRDPCGCSEAAIGLLFGAVTGGAALGLPVLFSFTWWQATAGVVVIAIAGLLVGKSVGVSRGRRRFRAAVAQLHGELASRLRVAN